MRTIHATDRQTLMDIAIQYYGSSASIIDLCKDNDLELDSNIVPGQAILLQDAYPDSAAGDIADYIQANDIIVVGTFDQTSSETVLATNDDDYIITNNNDYISA